MFSSQETTKSAGFIAMLGLLTVLGGCGGNDKKKEDENTCFDNPVIFFVCLFSSEASDSSPSGKPTTDSGVTGAVTTVPLDEYEPNNVLDNANVMSLSSTPMGASSHMSITGSVQRGYDASDNFIFTPTQSGSYRIYLCGVTCDEAAKDDAVYVMLFDQTQTTIAGTPVGVAEDQVIDVQLTAGLAYYVEVNGYNVDGYRYDYQLAVSQN